MERRENVVFTPGNDRKLAMHSVSIGGLYTQAGYTGYRLSKCAFVLL
jgi:hypothetical protein